MNAEMKELIELVPNNRLNLLLHKVETKKN